jgi:hypothetical protein
MAMCSLHIDATARRADGKIQPTHQFEGIAAHGDNPITLTDYALKATHTHAAKSGVARGGENLAAMLLFYFRETVEYYSTVIVRHAATSSGTEVGTGGGAWATEGGVYMFLGREALS